MGKFTIKTGRDGQYYFNLKAGNGEIILSSEGYGSKQACMSGIESVRLNSKDTARYDRTSTANGMYYFRLKAGNGQVIGKSEMYSSSAACENGIVSVKNNAPFASLEDL